MIRALRYFIIIGLLAAAAVWLAEQPGAVSLQWGGYQIDTSFGVMAVGLGILAITSGLLYRLWLFVCRAPGSVRMTWRGHRRGRGYQALTKGMVAVAAGDAEEARRQARKADNLLSEPPLTMLLSAQAAQLSGDERAAERFFRAMTENRETEFLGLRGLLNQA
ncbi:MAG: heme biosynthesis protein HemY, partial [Rhodospirillales bacterium]|nr:heme biosynthesis protein HemY [Rhodospirillales bacterium]